MHSQSGTNVWGRPAAKQPVVAAANAWARPVASRRPAEEIEPAAIADAPNVCEMRVEAGRLRATVDGLRELTETMRTELRAHEAMFASMRKEIDQLRFAVNSRPVGSASGYASAGPPAR